MTATATASRHTARAAAAVTSSSSSRKAIGLVFPGQGSQSVGMGKELHDTFASAREVWETVDDALGEPLSKLAFSGDKAELSLTRNAQPAILAASIAALRSSETIAGLSIRKQNSSIDVTCALGHSLGEYSALVASGALSLKHAVRAVRYRGDIMQQASEEFCITYRGSNNNGSMDGDCIGMAALLKFESARVNEFCLELEGRLETADLEGGRTEVCQVANINSDGQIVLSGTRAGVQIGIELAKASYGSRRAVWLPVSAPFHCSIMQPAAQRLRIWFDEQGPDFWAVDGTDSIDSCNGSIGYSQCLPVICNVSTLPMDTSNPKALIESLTQQVTAPVRWSDSVRRACMDIDMDAKDGSLGLGCVGFVEFGGSVLGSLISQTTTSRGSKKLDTISITSPADVEGLSQRLSEL